MNMDIFGEGFYAGPMTTIHPDVLEVLPVAQAREEISQVVKRFREEGLKASPVVFGSHRRPEAVTIPYDLFRALLPAIEDILVAQTIRERADQPEVGWHDALAEVGVSQAAVDAVDLAAYSIDGA